MASINEMINLHSYKFGRPQGGRSAFAPFAEAIKNKMIEEQKQKNIEQQMTKFKQLAEIASQTEPKTALADTKRVIDDDTAQRRRGVTNISTPIPTRSVSIDESGNLKTKIGFRNPTPQEIKSRFDLEQAQRNEAIKQRKDRIVDDFVEGRIDRNELIRQSQNVGITGSDIRDALERKNLMQQTNQQEINEVIPDSPGQQINQTGESRQGDQAGQGGEFEVTEVDPVTGQPKKIVRKKKSAAQEKRDVENKEIAGQIQNIVGLFNKARSEAEGSFIGEEFGKASISGRIANRTALAQSQLGSLPAVKTFQDRIKAFATIVAKAAGEVRPTDRDIERFSNALVNLKNSDAENALQLEQILKDVQAKGQDISWAEPLVRQFESRTGQNVDVSIGDTPTFDTPEEAMGSNLPSGTKVIIGGRPAILR